MKAFKKKIIVSSILLTIAGPSFAASSYYQQNSMGDDSNITIVGGITANGNDPILSLTGGVLAGGFNGGPFVANGFTTVYANSTNIVPNLPDVVPGGEAPNITAYAVISSFGVNFFAYSIGFLGVGTNYTDFGPTQGNPASWDITVGEPLANSVNVSSPLPTPQVTLIQPASASSPPIYHIQMTSASFQNSNSQYSNIASAPYFEAYTNSQPWQPQDFGTYVITPVAIQGISDNNYQLTPEDFYYQGNLTQFDLYQNFNNLEIDGTNLASNTNNPLNANAGFEQNANGQPYAVPPANSSGNWLSIQILPLEQNSNGNADPIYANGMNQVPFLVQILDSNGNPLSADATTDPSYAWMYNYLYFVDTDDNTLITNTQMNDGSLAISSDCGPYPNAINTTTGGPAGEGCATTNQNGKIYYFSTSQAGVFNIVGMLEANKANSNGTSTLAQVNPTEVGGITFYAEEPLDSSPFGPTGSSNNNISGWSQANNQLTFNSALQPTPNITQYPYTSATYLDLDNPALPEFVGFNSYLSASSYNLPGKLEQTPAVGVAGVVANATLSFSAFAGDVTNLAVDAVNDFGTYYETASYGD